MKHDTKPGLEPDAEYIRFTKREFEELTGAILQISEAVTSINAGHRRLNDALSKAAFN